MCKFQTTLGVAGTALVLSSQFVAASPAISPDAPSKAALEARDDSSTWHTTLEIGSSQWHIGDAISQHFEDNYMKKICSSTGCDGGSPMSFKYLTSTDGISSLGTGTITMEGNSDNNIAVIDQMLDAVEAALVASSDCKFNVKAQKCANNPGPSDDTWTKKRETAGIALSCGDIEFNSCYLVNYIQATMYDADGDQKAQVTFNGASEDPQGMTCSDFLDPINTALTALGPLDIAGVEGVSAATSVVSAICGGG